MDRTILSSLLQISSSPLAGSSKAAGQSPNTHEAFSSSPPTERSAEDTTFDQLLNPSEDAVAVPIPLIVTIPPQHQPSVTPPATADNTSKLSAPQGAKETIEIDLGTEAYIETDQATLVIPENENTPGPESAVTPPEQVPPKFIQHFEKKEHQRPAEAAAPAGNAIRHPLHGVLENAYQEHKEARTFSENQPELRNTLTKVARDVALASTAGKVESAPMQSIQSANPHPDKTVPVAPAAPRPEAGPESLRVVFQAPLLPGPPASLTPLQYFPPDNGGDLQSQQLTVEEASSGNAFLTAASKNQGNVPQDSPLLIETESLPAATGGPGVGMQIPKPLLETEEAAWSSQPLSAPAALLASARISSDTHLFESGSTVPQAIHGKNETESSPKRALIFIRSGLAGETQGMPEPKQQRITEQFVAPISWDAREPVKGAPENVSSTVMPDEALQGGGRSTQKTETTPSVAYVRWVQPATEPDPGKAQTPIVQPPASFTPLPEAETASLPVATAFTVTDGEHTKILPVSEPNEEYFEPELHTDTHKNDTRKGTWTLAPEVVGIARSKDVPEEISTSDSVSSKTNTLESSDIFLQQERLSSASGAQPSQNAAPVIASASILASEHGPHSVRAASHMTNIEPPRIAHQISEALISPHDDVLEITLSPAELGKIRLSLHSTDGALQVTIHAEKPETLDLMRRNTEQLSRDLRSLGHADINFSFSPHSGGSDTRRQSDNYWPSEPDERRPEPPPPHPLPSARTVSGVLDLRM